MNPLSFAVLLSFIIPTRGVLLAQQGAATDTVFNSTTNTCLCSQDLIEDDPNVINIAGIFDINSYDWGPTIFEATVQFINERRIERALASPNQRLEYSLRNAECDATKATRAYWDIRTTNNDRPPQGIIGARCSGASIALARISELESVPHLSPASNSASLSDEENFPFFSRVVSPNNEDGEVGALVALLRSFNWERVTILATDAAFSQGLATEFRKIWTGQHDGWFGRVGHSDTIRIGADGLVDDESVQQTLGSIPFDDPSVNSRIILLFAHSQHAFQILEQAVNLQPDTICVGPSAWVGRDDPNTNFRWLPTPGYLGVTTFRNRGSFYQDFMEDLQAFQQTRGEEPWDELPAFGAELVDSIVAMTMALSATSDRRDGAAVVRALRALDFAGVSGRVHFTPNGDRKDPKFTVLNSAGAFNDEITWTEIGSTGTTIGSTEFSTRQVCIAQQGCIDLSKVPGDTYPEIPDPLPWWIFLLLVIFLLALMYVSYRYWRSKQKKRAYKMELEDFRKSVVGMRAAESHYMPTFVDSKTVNIKQSLRRSSSKSAVPKSETAVWCWQETATVMGNHHSTEIMDDPANCWIKYDSVGNMGLEAAFQNKKNIHRPRAGYVVDFKTMTQKKTKTGFTRAVKRFPLKTISNGTASNRRGSVVDPSDVTMGDLLPNALRGEPQMVLVEGDVVQITVQRDDGWSFGSKLHQTDETLAKELVIASINTAAEGPKSDDVNVSSATGWFQEDVTRVATETDVKAIQAGMGGEDALSPPAHWDIMQDPSTAQRFELQRGSTEYDAVAQHFLSTVNTPTSRVKARVVKIERVQNLAMWQSYIVKRQAICHRETGHTRDKTVLDQAVKRYERERLWHGSNVEVVTKILQQGFNRSFCGKNATKHGKGVYYARDASYSASTTYSVPDRKGLQYMMACRVIVGEYCKGRQDAVTPDVRDMYSHQLYDTTVDNVSTPSIYVTYHDAQAYPEYLVTFQK